MSTKLSGPVKESGLYEHVKTYQTQTHTRTCRKYKKKDCRLIYGRFFSARIILAKSLRQSLNLLEKNQIVAWREGILTKSKKIH